MIPETIFEKLEYAKRRLNDLGCLIDQNLLGSKASERQQLIQEFFFHLIGAADFIAQLVNEHLELRIKPYKVNISRVVEKIHHGNSSDPLIPALKALYVNLGKDPFPDDLRSDDAYIHRAYIYRHYVTHNNREPFHFVSGERTAYLDVDPNNPDKGQSEYGLKEDLNSMFKIMKQRCELVVSIIEPKDGTSETF